MVQKEAIYVEQIKCSNYRQLQKVMLTKITCYKSLGTKVTGEIWENVVKYSNLVKSLLCWIWSSETHRMSGDKKLEEVENNLIKKQHTQNTSM